MKDTHEDRATVAPVNVERIVRNSSAEGQPTGRLNFSPAGSNCAHWVGLDFNQLTITSSGIIADSVVYPLNDIEHFKVTLTKDRESVSNQSGAGNAESIQK